MKPTVLSFLLLFACTAFSQTKLLENTNLYGFVLNGKPLMVDSAGNLWTTDGTPSGTKIFTTKVKMDVSDNKENGDGTIAGTKMYFTGKTTTTGTELWCTDGTDAGTFLVKDITSGTGSTQLGDFFLLNDKIFFFASDATHGYELWTTDGTDAGTKFVKDINPGKKGSNPTMNGITLNNIAFFYADDGTHGKEIWKTDGTASGTQMVKDINPYNNMFPGFYFPASLYRVGNLIVFQADDGEHGMELWRSDGTGTGTYMIKDIHSGDSSSVGGLMHIYNNKIYFNVYPEGYQGTEVELWSSDGTAGGTKNVKTFAAATEENEVSLFDAVNFPDKFLFKFSKDSVEEIWSSDGSTNGTKMILSYAKGLTINLYTNWFSGFSDYNPQNLPPFNGKVFFSTKDQNDQNGKIWLTDGTTNGTQLVKALTDFDYSYFYGTNKLYFWAYHETNADSISLYKTDGTAAGTKAIQSFPRPDDTLYNPYPYIIFEFNGELYYSANDKVDNSNVNDFYRTGSGSSVPPVSGTYTFTGNGSWDTPSNWLNNQVPPANLSSGEIIIDPVAGGECLASGAKTLAPGVKLTIKSNKKLRFTN